MDALYFYLSGVTVFFTLLISWPSSSSSLSTGGAHPHEVPRPIAGSHKLEMLWSVIPFVIAMSFFVWGRRIFFKQSRGRRQNALEVYVVGKQWMWKFQHTTGQREINELHVPVGRKIKLIMATEDVIHDVYVPAFRIKADVVPGRYTMQWFEATKPGSYHLFCAEYCGMNHSGMGGWVVVMEPTEFDNWLSGNVGINQRPPPGINCFKPLGLRLLSWHTTAKAVADRRCWECSTVRCQLGAGQTVRGDESYIRESILNPQAKIVARLWTSDAYFQGVVNEEQMVQLIAYLKSLGSNAGQRDRGNEMGHRFSRMNTD